MLTGSFDYYPIRHTKTNELWNIIPDFYLYLTTVRADKARNTATSRSSQRCASFIMNSKITVHIISLVFLLYSCKESNENLIDSGVNLANKGKYNEAIKKYTKVINNNNKIQLAYYNRGLCYINIGEYQKSLDDFNTVLNLKTLGGGSIIFTLNSENGDFIEEAKYQVSYDDGIYGRAQARYFLDSLKSSYADFQALIEKNYSEKVSCILFQADIWHATGDDSTACKFAQRARSIAKKEGEITDCDNTIRSYCDPIK